MIGLWLFVVLLIGVGLVMLLVELLLLVVLWIGVWLFVVLLVNFNGRLIKRSIRRFLDEIVVESGLFVSPGSVHYMLKFEDVRGALGKSFWLVSSRGAVALGIIG